MELTELKKIIEALLLVNEKPLSLKQIGEVLEGVEAAQIKEAMSSLCSEYNQAFRGIQVAEIAGGFQFCTNPSCSEFIKKFFKTRRIMRLSGPALETLAIIAYKQPLTRAEMEYIRGVNVDGVIKTLLERSLIKIKGRKEVPGRPIMYGTTDEFLQYFGLKTLNDLPSLDEFAPKESFAAKMQEIQNKTDGEIQDEKDENPGIA